MKIELEKRDDGYFVRCGDRWEDSLCIDEALGVVASLLYRGDAPYLKTALQHSLWEARYGFRQPLLTEKSSASVAA